MKKMLDKFMSLDGTMKKNIGVISILIGVGFLLISILFSSGYSSEAGFMQSLSYMEMVFIEGDYIKAEFGYQSGSYQMITDGHYDGRVAIPLKYLVSISIIITLFGVGLTTLSKSNGRNLKEHNNG